MPLTAPRFTYEGFMPTDVVMPQMGESIAEGTIVRWIKKVGDTVQRDEPLFEISTDKVDAEIPAPAAGVLKEIRVQPGTTVAINTVVGIIGAAGDAASAPAPAPPAPTPAPAAAPPSQSAPPPAPPGTAARPKETPQSDGGSSAPPSSSSATSPAPSPKPAAPAPSAPEKARGEMTVDE